MSVYVFVGPTLPIADARAVLDAIYLPPAMAGDVYGAARRGAQAIGIIDGHLHRVPAVWHKEILWAMSQGVHVFGSAGIGALRAAELETFGMQGKGEIFEAFRDQVLEDDDEVAVAYGPAETGHRRLSEAMVDIRATLAAAEAHGVLAPIRRLELESMAKALFYPQRSYPAILERAGAGALPDAERLALRDWLPQGRVELQRLDALAMLRLMGERLASDPAKKRVGYTLEPSSNWVEARLYWDRKTQNQGDPHERAAAREA